MVSLAWIWTLCLPEVRIDTQHPLLLYRYSSSPEITPYSALIQNFFDGETGINTPAIHLTFDTDLSTENVASSLAVKAYVAREVGSSPKPENAVFLPIPCSVKYQLTERAGRE